ncbi:MAG: M3 family metallopeptidase [Candidatus Dependentiae bacterium]|jgi:thimet oligopeptidase
MMHGDIRSAEEAIGVVAASPGDIAGRVAYAKEHTAQDLANLFAIPANERTFDNTILAYDTMWGRIMSAMWCLKTSDLVERDQAMRDAALAAVNELSGLEVDLSSNREVYNALRAYEQGAWQSEKASLGREQRDYFIDLKRTFDRAGFALEADDFDRATQLKKEVKSLEFQFKGLINEDNSQVLVAKDALPGVDPLFVKTLEERDGMLVVPCNYPARAAIAGHCTNRETRVAFAKAFSNRGYPHTIPVLKELVEKRYDLAQLLGYKDWASYVLEIDMARDPETVQDFLDGIMAHAHRALPAEIAALTAELPEGVELDEKGRFRPGDLGYVMTQYRKKHFNLDHRKVAEYFPLEKVVSGIFHIYEQFLGIQLRRETVTNAWHESVRVLSVYAKDGSQLLGYILLDLFPRENKYGHACSSEQVGPAGEQIPVNLVVCNFPEATADRPSLLDHREAETFFHEFGHAIHYVLGRTSFHKTAGFWVQHDFVEMPSQIFERWLSDRKILKEVTGHYLTGEPIPDEMIDSLLASKNFGNAMHYLGQGTLSQVSLDLHTGSREKDPIALWQQMGERFQTYSQPAEWSHGIASFGHLEEYSAKYYCYMWSEVFADDCFAQIKKHGLRDEKIGAKFCETILKPGGSIPASEMLHNFLDREPNQEAFLGAVGFTPVSNDDAS